MVACGLTGAGLRAEQLDEFRRELALMASLRPHPNVLTLVGACTVPPHLAIVTQLCEHGSLFGLLHSPTQHLTWHQLLEMARGAARGMAHLHAHQLVHRDLKSGNLLVDAEWNVRVADFGLSRVFTLANTLTGGLGTFQWVRVPSPLCQLPCSHSSLQPGPW